MKQSIVLLILSIGACTPTLYSQVAAGLGGIAGIVTDPSGSSVPGATVLVDNERLGIHRKFTTGNGGVFNAPALVPSGGYEITVDAAGFSKFQNKNITVLVGQEVNIHAALDVQSSATSVEVQDAAQMIEDKIDVSQNVTQTQIENLPINGRRVDSFVLLTPTVVPDGTFGLLSFRGISGGNTFMTDGNDTTETFYGENACRTRDPPQISQDAGQDFHVLSSPHSAHYGRATCAVVT